MIKLGGEEAVPSYTNKNVSCTRKDVVNIKVILVEEKLRVEMHTTAAAGHHQVASQVQ